VSEADKAFIAGMGLGSLIWLAILFAVGSGIEESWKTDCVKRGLAQYNPKTAVFEWVEPDTTFQKTLDTIETNSVKEMEADVDAYMKRVCP